MDDNDNFSDNLFLNLYPTTFLFFSFLPLIVPFCMLFIAIYTYGSITKFAFYIGFYILFMILLVTFNNNFYPQQMIELMLPKCDCINAIPHRNQFFVSTAALIFTIFYIFLPNMIYGNKNFVNNYLFMTVLIGFVGFDIWIKSSCILGYQELLLVDTLIGIILGTGFSAIVYAIGKKYTFTTTSSGASNDTETTSGGQTCSMPSKTKFKCSVYKNGELISSQMK